MKTSKFHLYNRGATSNPSFKHPTALLMNVISWLWNPPSVKKFIGVEKTCEKSMTSVQGWWNCSNTEWVRKRWNATKTACQYPQLLIQNQTLALFQTLKRLGWNWSIRDFLREKRFFKMSKFHGVLKSCRVKRAPRSAEFPNFRWKAYESVSECSRRSHIDEQGAKLMLCKNDIGCDERCWKISMSQAFPRQLFIAVEERPWAEKEISTKQKIAELRVRSKKTWPGAPLFNV